MNFSEIQAPEFGPEQTITVGQLVPGDWVVSFPAQLRIRGMVVGSGVKTIDPGYGWYTQSRPRGPKMPVPSRRVSFLTGSTALHVPSECKIIVRRQVQP